MSEEIKNQETVVETETTPTPAPAEPAVDYQAELAKAMAEVKKYKAVADKNASEAADYKKKWKATLDETQQANMAKEEADKALMDELNALRRESAIGKTEKEYLSMGYAPELANRAAVATYENNVDELVAVQKAVIENFRKSITAELTKQMPTPPISNSGEQALTQEQFDRMTIAEQVELKNKNPELFKQFTN